MSKKECKHNWEIKRINMDWKSQVHYCTKCGILRESRFIRDWTNGIDYLFPTTWVGIGTWNITKIKEDNNNE